MTSLVAFEATNDNGAAGATATPSVERNESSCMQKTGTLMTTVEPPPLPAKAEPGQTGATLLATVRYALAYAGAEKATVDTAAQAVAAGQVYQAATTIVKDQKNQGLTNFFEVLDLLISHITAGIPLTAAREAAEALSATPASQDGHHPWCEAGRCRPERYDDGAVLTEHHGPRYEAAITDGTETIRLRAELGSDENLLDDRAQVFMAAGNADGLAFHSDELDKVIDDLGAFVDGLRHLRRVMDQGRAA